MATKKKAAAPEPENLKATGPGVYSHQVQTHIGDKVLSSEGEGRAPKPEK